MEDLEIYFSDLTPEAQKKVLEFYRISSPEEANLDVMPLAVIPEPENTITIEVEGGVVTDVRNLPKGWDYELIDHDVQ